jgi:putative ATPase
VPRHLCDTHSAQALTAGKGEGYLYPHAYPKHYVAQQYLPDEHKGKTFYQPSEQGYERKLQAFLQWMKD